MNPSKDSMLIDIQYIKANKRNNTPDYLYVIWRDLISNEKHLQCIEEPKIDIYFEKRELRTHKYNKNYEHIENLERKTVKYKDIIYAIADDMGPQGKQALNNAFQTKNYNALNNFHLYPYVFASDYDCASWYRIQWLKNLDNDLPKKLHKGFLDIEVDGLEVPGMPSPTDCPVNAITLIDGYDKTCYTFIYTHRPCIEKDMSHMTDEQRKKEIERRRMYQHMYAEQDELICNPDSLYSQLHEMFDESYGKMDYKLYFYDNEAKMLIHFFQLINELKLDIVGIWNISFDIPYLMNRLEALGYNPADVMCHPDFPVKQCYFKEDKINHDIKNKSDSFHLSSYTTFYDQMELYASIRKGAQELRSYRLNFIAERELEDTKLDYSDDGDIKTLPYTNFIKFIIYNIKDVLLQYGIEEKTCDFDTLYISSYKNATAYDKVFKQTVKLRNVQYVSFLKQGLIPGNNINIYNVEDNVVKSDDEEDEDDDSFEGALVADPIYNGYVGLELYGQKTNNIFSNAIDFDMSSFYPSSIFAMNIDPSTLIFKTIIPGEQYDIKGGDLKFRGITGKYLEEENDFAKEFIDNFQTGNYMTTGTKWMNMPDVNEVFKQLKKKLG